MAGRRRLTLDALLAWVRLEVQVYVPVVCGGGGGVWLLYGGGGGVWLSCGGGVWLSCGGGGGVCGCQPHSISSMSTEPPTPPQYHRTRARTNVFLVLLEGLLSLVQGVEIHVGYACGPA